MSRPADVLLEEAKKLSAQDRALVAEKLLETLDPASDGDVDALWATEVAERAREAERDPSILVQWAELKTEIEKDLKNQ